MDCRKWINTDVFEKQAFSLREKDLQIGWRAGWGKHLQAALQLSVSLVAQSCPTLRLHEPQHARPPAHHQLPGFTQIHVYRVGDAIKSSHPLSSPSPPAFNLSQHQALSNESVLRIRWLKYRSFSINISPSSEYSGLISFRMDWLDLLVLGSFNGPEPGHLELMMRKWNKKRG